MAGASPNELIMGAGNVLKKHAGDVAGTAHARGPLRRLIRIGPKPSDETFEVVRRHRLLGDD